MSIELEVSIEKKKMNLRVFENTTIVFFNLFVREKGKLYLNTKGQHSIFFKQLLVKEILVNEPWKLELMGPTALVITKLAK